jgi:hypothetical protein
MNKEQTLAVIKEYAKAQEAIKKAEADFYGKIAKM